jgi:hypothetical protein
MHLEAYEPEQRVSVRGTSGVIFVDVFDHGHVRVCERTAEGERAIGFARLHPDVLTALEIPADGDCLRACTVPLPPEDVDLIGRRAAERFIGNRKAERDRREREERQRAALAERRQRVAPKPAGPAPAPAPEDGGPQDDWEPPRGGR